MHKGGQWHITFTKEFKAYGLKVDHGKSMGWNLGLEIRSEILKVKPYNAISCFIPEITVYNFSTK